MKKTKAEVYKALIKNGLTMDDLKKNDPGLYEAMGGGDVDVAVSNLRAIADKTYRNDPEKAAKETRDAVDDLGFNMGDVDDRLHWFNRFTNGAQLTTAQALNGVRKAIKTLGFDDDGAMQALTDELKGEAEKDSKLFTMLGGERSDWLASPGYKAAAKRADFKIPLNNIDFATASGSVFPEVAAGALLPLTKAGAVADLGVGASVLGGQDSPELSDYLAVLGSSALGYGASAMLTGNISKNAEELQAAMKAEPHLARDLAKLMKEKNIPLTNLGVAGDVRLKDVKLPKTEAEARDWVNKDLAAKDADIKYKSPHSKSTPSFPEMAYIEKRRIKALDREDTKNTLPELLARQADGTLDIPDKFLEHSEALESFGFGPLVEHSKVASKLKGAEKNSYIAKVLTHYVLMGVPSLIFPGQSKIARDNILDIYNKIKPAIKKAASAKPKK